MAISRKNKSGRPRTTSLRPSVISVPEPAQALAVVSPQAPTVDSAQSLPLVQSPEPPVVPTTHQIAADSPIRMKAMQILALRAAGLEESEIAEQLKLSKGTIRNYVYLAGASGWLDANALMANPVDTVEYRLLHKVVRNLDASLDSEDKAERAAVTDKLFDATLARHWAPAAASTAPPNLVAIRIEMPPGPAQVVREGTVQGIAAWTEAEEA